jgi:hypothetical protein
VILPGSAFDQKQTTIGSFEIWTGFVIPALSAFGLGEVPFGWLRAGSCSLRALVDFAILANLAFEVEKTLAGCLPHSPWSAERRETQKEMVEIQLMELVRWAPVLLDCLL